MQIRHSDFFFTVQNLFLGYKYSTRLAGLPHNTAQKLASLVGAEQVIWMFECHGWEAVGRWVLCVYKIYTTIRNTSWYLQCDVGPVAQSV